MNIKIDVNENFEEEIIIRCKKISPLVQDVQNAILDITSSYLHIKKKVNIICQLMIFYFLKQVKTGYLLIQIMISTM